MHYGINCDTILECDVMFVVVLLTNAVQQLIPEIARRYPSVSEGITVAPSALLSFNSRGTLLLRAKYVTTHAKTSETGDKKFWIFLPPLSS